MVQQNPSDDGADGRTTRERGGPHTDGPAARLGVGKHVGDQRQARRHERRTTDTHQRASSDQDARGGSERGDDRGDAEHRGTQQQDASTADAVADVAHRDEQSCDEEPVDVENPQLLGGAGIEGVGDRRDREVEDGEVHRDQENRKGQHGQSPPRASIGARIFAGALLGRTDADGHDYCSPSIGVNASTVLCSRAPAYAVRIDGTVMSTLYANNLFPTREESWWPTSVRPSSPPS